MGRKSFIVTLVSIVICLTASGNLSAATVTLDTDTGTITGSLGGGTGPVSFAVDSTNKIARWTFDGNLNISSNTTIRTTGSNMVSLYSTGNISIGSYSTFTVEPDYSSSDGLYHPTAGAGGGGDGGNGNTTGGVGGSGGTRPTTPPTPATSSSKKSRANPWSGKT